MKQEIGRGAEAVVYEEDGQVVKERVPKGYRIKEIDDKLRRSRTRREAKVLNTLEQINFPAPKMLEMCDKAMQLRMEMVHGSKLRDVLYQNPLKYSEEIGVKVGMMHAEDVIHGDLTTSNMILDNEIKFIDFGLSFFSSKAEDKAVDLHLLRQALESKHYQNWEECFEAVLRGYKKGNPEAESVLKRFDQVEARGRNKNKH